MVDKANSDIANNSAALTNALNTIKGFAANKDASALTIAQLTAAGVTGAMDCNLGTHNAVIANSTGYVGAIERAGATNADTTVEIQALVNNVNTVEHDSALSTINAFTATAGTNYVGNLTITLLVKAGIPTSSKTALDNAVTANLPSYRIAILNNKTFADTAALQTVISNANDAMNKIGGYNATSVSSLTIQQLIDAGVTGTVAGNLAAYKTAIGSAAPTGGAATLAQIQALIDSANSAAGLSNAITTVNNAKGAANTITAAQLVAAGALNVDTSLVAPAGGFGYDDEIQASKDLSTTALIQKMVDKVNLRFATVLIIRNYAANKDASALTIDQLKTAAITGTVDANLTAYQTLISKTPANSADTISEIQGLINSVNTAQINAAIAVIEKYRTAKDASAMTMTQLNATGITPAIDANLDAYKAAVAASKTAFLVTSDVQSMVTNVNGAQQTAMIATIANYSANKDASPLTTAQLASAGITGAVDANLARYKAAIQSATQAYTAANLQAMINQANLDAINAAIAVIKSYNATTISNLTIAQLTAAGVVTTAANSNTPAISDNLGAYQVTFGSLTDAQRAALAVTADIQAIVNTVNATQSRLAAVIVIKGYAGNASAMTLAQLNAAGVTTNNANLAAYQAAVTASASTNLDTTSKIQAVIAAADKKVIAIAKIAAAKGDAVKSAGITDTDLTDAGVVNENPSNLVSYYQSAISNSSTALDTLPAIQSLVNTANAKSIQDAIDQISIYAANIDASSLTVAQLVKAGVVNAIAANLGTHNATDMTKSTGYMGVIERSAASQVSTTAQLQALIDGVNAITQNATIVSVTGGTVEGTIPNGSSDPNYLPTLSIDIASTTTSVSAANLSSFGQSKVTLYTNSDFTGLVGTTGVAISSNSTVLYAKVVSGDSTVTKYFKVIFNVVDQATKYVIGAPAKFDKVGSNFKATVTVDRVKAAALTNPKLYVVYTWSNGSQTYQTLDVTGSTKDIVTSSGIKSVQVFLVDGDVDWSAGMPSFKSNFIEIAQ